MSKIKAFFAGHKIILSLIITLVIEILLYLISTPFISIGLPKNFADNCFAITFDTWQMNGVDKIVVKTENKETVITEKKVIKQIVNNTKTADSSDYKIPYGGYYITLYNKGTVLREMEGCAIFPDTWKLYKDEFPHYIFNLYGSSIGGVHLSAEVMNAISEELKNDGNEYYKFFERPDSDKPIDWTYLLFLFLTISTGYIIILIPVLLIVLLPGAIRRRKNKAAND